MSTTKWRAAHGTRWRHRPAALRLSLGGETFENPRVCLIYALFYRTEHLAVHDAQPFRRLMRRVQIAGDKPV